jgi:hypothetical protein
VCDLPEPTGAAAACAVINSASAAVALEKSEECYACELKRKLLLLLLLLPGEDSEECAICLSLLELPCITSCGHVYCRRCECGVSCCMLLFYVL